MTGGPYRHIVFQAFVRTAVSRAPTPIDPDDWKWRAEQALWKAHHDLDLARNALKAALTAQDPNRHYKGLPESPEVIAAYDQVRAAEATVATLEREGRRA